MNYYYSILKTSFKKRLQLRFFEGSLPIVVASNGRAASTLLYKAIRAGYIQARFNIDQTSLLGKFLFRLSGSYVDRMHDIEFSRAAVFKTHCLWNSSFGQQAKFVFVHSDPLESALSVDLITKKCGENWYKEHQYHLEATGRYEDIFDKDVLNYENQIISWGRADDERILCVAFEELWIRTTQISAHVGFPVNLEPFRHRAGKKMPGKINDRLFERLGRVRCDLFFSENARNQEVDSSCSGM